MQQIQIIGNLGDDCQSREFNDRKFVTFRVACSEKVRDQQGEREITTWYSCSFNRFESGIVQYLKKGTTVFVQGMPTYSIYDSAAMHCKMIDVRIFVDKIQLCGSKRDDSPKDDGVPVY